METTYCLLCGKTANLVHADYTGYQQPQTFRIYTCPSCGTNFSMPRTDASRLYDVIYLQRENHPGYARYWKYAKDVKNIIDPLDYLAKSEPTYFGVIDFLNRKKISKSLKILEVGSGLGYLTYALRRTGYTANAIELSKVAVEEAIHNFGNYYTNTDLFEYSEKNQSSFDVVISTEVLEHVENPIKFIQAMLDLLKPNGYLVLTTPNKSFFPKEMIWESSLPPIHFWWFSEESMKYIAALLGVSIEFLSFKKYFLKRTLSRNKEYCIKRPLPHAVIDINGNIIVKDKCCTDGTRDSSANLHIKSIVKMIAKKIIGDGLLNKIYLYVRFKKTHIFAGKRCHYMCAIFKK